MGSGLFIYGSIHMAGPKLGSTHVLSEGIGVKRGPSACAISFLPFASNEDVNKVIVWVWGPQQNLVI